MVRYQGLSDKGFSLQSTWESLMRKGWKNTGILNYTRRFLKKGYNAVQMYNDIKTIRSAVEQSKQIQSLNPNSVIPPRMYTPVKTNRQGGMRTLVRVEVEMTDGTIETRHVYVNHFVPLTIDQIYNDAIDMTVNSYPNRRLNSIEIVRGESF